jgi:DNA-binding response OmpR family regulator
MATTRVLVVEDDRAIRALVAKILERKGCAVDVADDGDVAIAMLGTGAYDVLVLDLMMPRVPGTAVLAHMKEQTGRQPVVIVMSAAPPPAERLDGRFVHSVVRKPFDIEMLADLVMAAAEAAHGANETEAPNIIEFPFHRPQSGQ